MGATKSTLEEHGYTVKSNKDGVLLATSKEGDSCVIKVIPKSKLCDITPEKFSLYFETLKKINHPHVLSYKNSFEENNIFYIVSNHCQGGNLAEKIKEKKALREQFTYEEIMQWTVQICMALKYIHENDLIYEDLSPQKIFVTEFGNICLGEFNFMQKNDMAPDQIRNGLYKSDIWSLGCVIYELCTLESFTATNEKYRHPYSTLPQDIEELLIYIFQEDPSSRPTASDILARPFIINFIMKKCKETTNEVQVKLKNLRDLADCLEIMHWGTTIGSLTGGVIAAVGAIVGLIMATLGASLIVTLVNIGAALAGGATAVASNITNMVKEFGGRYAVRRLIKELEEKINSMDTWIQDIGQALEDFKKNIDSAEIENGDLILEKQIKSAVRVGKCINVITKLVQMIHVANIGSVAAQTSMVVKVTEGVTWIFPGLFMLANFIFIAMDVREIHCIHCIREANGPSDQKIENVKSETMKFVLSIRQNADVLQKVLNKISEGTTYCASKMLDSRMGYGKRWINK